jgi:tetratricopeptide (TPR) repeat protein
MVRLLLGLLIVSLGFCTPDTPEYSVQEWIVINQKILVLMQEGNRQFDRGNYTIAVDNYQEILGYNPNDAQASNKYHQALQAKQTAAAIESTFANGTYTETLRNIKLLQELNPHDQTYEAIRTKAAHIQALEAKGDDLYQKAQYNEAIEQYAKIRQNNEKDTRSLAKIDKCRKVLDLKKSALQSFSNGDYAAAHDYYQKILSKNPQDSLAQQSIVDCNEALTLITQADNSISKSDFSTAFEKLKKVVNLNPHDATASKRSVDYKRIVDYYTVNHDLLKASLYEYVLTNYDDMLVILDNNLKLGNERRRYSQCLNLKEKAYSTFSSENYQEAAAIANKILEINPQDELTSRNAAIIAYALQLKEKAGNAYASGKYQESLAIYQKLSTLRLLRTAPISPAELLRGQQNALSFPLVEATAATIVIEGQSIKCIPETAGMWTAEIFIPRTSLNSYKAAKVFVKNSTDTKVIYIPYRVADNKTSAPIGYTTHEQDVQL